MKYSSNPRVSQRSKLYKWHGVTVLNRWISSAALPKSWTIGCSCQQPSIAKDLAAREEGGHEGNGPLVCLTLQ